MNWTQELRDLYDKNEHMAGKVEQGRYGEPLVLLPIFHTTVASQLAVAVSPGGDFLYAAKVIEEDKLTIIPVTEKSAVRTSSPEPHPLCDNLKYLAGDYMDYVIPEKGKDYSEYYKLYIEQLGQWAESDFSHEKVSAVWNYLKKGTLMEDLIRAGILKTDDSGRVMDKVKLQNILQTESFVRFIVEKKWDGSESLLLGEAALPECWKDISLMQSYILYCRSQDMPRGLSYLTGETVQLASFHPKKIRNEGDSAKLISANDKDNYTFRGRFADKDEAFTIGYEDSQRIHNALKWIIRKQGRSWGGLTVVSWESDLHELPDWSLDSDKVCDIYESADSWDDEPESAYPGTNPMDAARFSRAVMGYGRDLDVNSQTFLMAFDAATTGRLSLMACQSLKSSAYLENLKRWHEECAWIFPKFKDKSPYEYYGAAGVKDIANLLYGVESGGELTLKGTNEKMYAEVCKRLIPCIILGKAVPDDMVRTAVRRASSPVSFESDYHWRRTLALACSLIKKKCTERKKEVWTVALNEESRDRSYLYGRLLAVADRIEYRTFEKGDERVTNARRYMNAFSQQPFRTWKVIEDRMQSYYQKLAAGEQLKYSHLIDEICWQFKDGEFEKNEALSGLYLLGFHNQAYALRKNYREAEEDE